ncbi:MAG: tetratricopeptide repeat protein, partial [Candidatus Acidiferrales bacterium]
HWLQHVSPLVLRRRCNAEPLNRRALAIVEKALGPEHPNVSTGLNNLAELYRAQGKYVQAEPLYQRALAIAEKALGPEHPQVATVLENYAALLHKLNRDAEAEKMEARAQAIRAKHAQENPQK